jgi:hypothetical protein
MAANRPTPEFDDELLSAYVDNELTARERTAVEERLRTDERARQTLAELQRAADALKALPARRLGRDLTADIWAAIDSQKNDSQKNDDPAVLTLPPRNAAGSSGKGRGLIWAALAIAAALMLMVLRPGAELRNEGSVARTAPQSGAKAPKDSKEDARDLARVESVGVDAGASAAARQETASAEPQSAAVLPAERDDARAAPRPDTARSRDSILADGNLAESDFAGRGLAEKQATAPRVARGVATSAPAGIGPSKLATEAQPNAAEAIVADAAGREQIRTIEVVVSGGAATFERMLTEHRIAMVDDAADELAPLGATASGAADEAKATSAEVVEELDGAQSDRAVDGGAADGEAGQAAAPVAILVEASPAAIAEILATLQPQTESRYALRRSAKELAELEAVAGAEGGGATLREAGAANNRAWRVPIDSYFDDGAALAKLAMEEPAAQPATTAAAPAEGGDGAGGGRGGRGGGFGGGGFGGRAFDASQPRERVLFIVRPE